MARVRLVESVHTGEGRREVPGFRWIRVQLQGMTFLLYLREDLWGKLSSCQVET